ncbi:MAG TPA: PAS domain-containing protein [Gaiellaceae bacterium]|nr:PAS domain-containing protein [Gaiellaceae bacterium]
MEQLPGSFVWTADRELRLTSIAGAALPVLGIGDPAEVVGRGLAEVVSGTTDRGAAIVDAHRRALGGEPTTFTESTSTWTFDVHVEPIREGDEIVGAGGIAVDASKRRLAERALVESEARFRTLVERLPICTYVNPLGLPIRTTYISPYIERLLGFPARRWLEEDDFWVERLHPDDRERVLAGALRTHKAGEPFRGTYRMLHADGGVVTVLDETVPVADERGEPLFLQGFLLPIDS